MNWFNIKGDITLQTIGKNDEGEEKRQDDRRIRFTLEIDSPLVEKLIEISERRGRFW